MFNRNKIIIILTILLFTLGFAVQAAGHTVVTIGLESPKSLDPATNSNDPEILFQRTIYDFLLEVGVDDMGTTVFIPNLATSWEVSPDELTYTFDLRDGVIFHDGSAFSSADVIHTFERLKALGSPANALLGEYTVEAVGDDRVVFTLAAPNADFLFGISSRWSLIIRDGNDAPGTIAEGSDTPLQNFNGTGAFILTDYTPEMSATFTANEDYWHVGAPGVQGLVFQFINDAATRVNALANGEIDAIFKLSIPQLRELQGNSMVKTHVVPTNQHPVIRLRSDSGFAGENPLVRQAFKLATDRELLNDDLMGGAGTVGNNDPIGPVYGSFYQPLDASYEYNPERACALLTEAGYADGYSGTLYVVDAFNYSDLGVALQEQWAQACINVEVLLRPQNIYYGDNEWMEVELGITGWGSNPVAQQYLVQAYVTDGVWNESRWSNTELDELVAMASVTADLDQRTMLYERIAEIFVVDAPIIVPWFSPMIGATTTRIEGFNLAAFAGLTDLRTLSISQ